MAVANTTRKGTRWATLVAEMLRPFGLVSRKAWREPGDDMVLSMRQAAFSVEAKDQAAWAPSVWLKQATDNAGPGQLPIVISHRRGKAAAEDAYVIMSGATLTRLLAKLR